MRKFPKVKKMATSLPTIYVLISLPARLDKVPAIIMDVTAISL